MNEIIALTLLECAAALNDVAKALGAESIDMHKLEVPTVSGPPLIRYVARIEGWSEAPNGARHAMGLGLDPSDWCRGKRVWSSEIGTLNGAPLTLSWSEERAASGVWN